MVQQPTHASAHTRRRSRRQVRIYLDGTQLAEREPAKVFNDLAETPGVEIRTKRDHGAPMHLKSYEIDGKLLRNLRIVLVRDRLWRKQDREMDVVGNNKRWNSARLAKTSRGPVDEPQVRL